MNDLGKFSLMANLMPNKGMQKVGQMADQFGAMKEASLINKAAKESAQGYANHLASQPNKMTIKSIDDMLNGLYPNGADPSIRDFYVNLMGKYGF